MSVHGTGQVRSGCANARHATVLENWGTESLLCTLLLPLCYVQAIEIDFVEERDTDKDCDAVTGPFRKHDHFFFLMSCHLEFDGSFSFSRSQLN